MLWFFLLFENYGLEVGDQSWLVPQPKSWGPVSPGPYGCCAYVLKTQNKWYRSQNENFLQERYANFGQITEKINAKLL